MDFKKLGYTKVRTMFDIEYSPTFGNVMVNLQVPEQQGIS
jgi:hypothetical protein